MSPLWILKRILWEQPTELYPESYKLRKVIFFVPPTDIQIRMNRFRKGADFLPFRKIFNFSHAKPCPWELDRG